MNGLRSSVAAAALALGLLGGVAGCTDANATDTSTGDDVTSAAAEQAADVTVQDTWVKAVDSGMTAAFGLLVNDSDRDVRVVSSTSDASPVMELHETVESTDGQMVMREKDGGFIIPANSQYVLQPGANHLMLMDVVQPIKAGDVVTFAVEFEDGSAFEFEAPVKDYTGANERYVDE
ncbi:copper chaperone PCu(A)C [Micromonospora sp. NBC_01813]|uniref:copper chaperone PCu(A)C n=1 Tax=Micromonospora sp. NBC_01813 TaxID=2975988 RepID=UPI002DDB517E|nr:copper chaperone PCu(A)C [Micromonospora sp. NBC_01813]WSA10818.1 copper chaperone PCu(A)C [Micromonospora sp. NBC_01813]